jgi:hypoxanthine phosphoribosyltransferase
VSDAEHERLGWEEFGTGARELAAQIRAGGYDANVMLAIARGGLPVVGAVSYALGVKNCATINVEYYTGIDERLDVPVILPPLLDVADLTDARLLVVDDVADTGETLRLVAETLRPAVADLRTAVLYEKSRSVVRCDYVWRRTERWIEFPWSDPPADA